MATLETIDHTTLSHLIDAGSVRNAQAVGQPGGWSVVVKYGASQHALAASRSKKVRLFKKLETLVAYLAGVGITNFDVDAAGFNPASTQRVQRPDRSAALRRAHQAVAYDTYVREAVQAALDDPTPGVPHEEAKSAFAAKRAALPQRSQKANEC
ncbi:antitoxin PaaA2 family protein [Chromobacterium amazonense]|uniref:antitoxin PaaA2 family protein n=1 Tax=Chromobacterium amazonense TaxID=1382803 RepID=UPI003F7934F3